MNQLFHAIQQGESKTLEFKQSLPKYAQIAKTVVAFANTSGGRIVIGVQDDGTIQGIDNDNIFELQESIYASLYEQIHPTVTPEIYTAHLDGKSLLIIEVFRGSALPYFLKNHGKANGTYIRIGASNRQASTEYIAELERQRQHISYDETPCYEVSLDDIDDSVLYQQFQAKGIQLDDSKYRNLRLIVHKNGNDYPSYGLLILLGYFDHVTTQCARFKGTDMQVFLDRKEYTGNLFSQLKSAELFIKNHLHLRGEIHGLQRTDTLEIPEVAIREALINAYVHRDYTNRGRNIKIGIYDDMVNIVSAGGFVPTLTLQDLSMGRSEVRNRVIARVFKALGLIEQWGTGLGRIYQSCEQVNLPKPNILEKGDYVDVELWRTKPSTQIIADNNNERTDDSIELINENGRLADDYERLRTITNDYERLSTEQLQIIKLFEIQNSIHRQDVTQILNVENTKAYTLLKSLVERGILIRQGKGRATSYILNHTKEN